MGKKLKKLAVIRTEEGPKCPFGLPVTEGCRSAGELIHRMAPLNIMGEDSTPEEKKAIAQANRKLWKKHAPDHKCPYARHLFSNREVVECGWGSQNPTGDGSGVLKGSPFSWRMFHGTAPDGLYSVPPSGYYMDNTIDQGFYYGPFSWEVIANDSTTNKKQYSRDTSPHGDENMSLAKEAQLDLDGFGLPMSEPQPPSADDNALMVTEPMMVVQPQNQPSSPSELLVEVDEEPGFDFALPMIPGGSDQSELEVEEGESEDVMVEDDPWGWTVSDFLPWLQKMMNNIPGHSGKESAGLERAISYLEALDKEISKAVRMDLKNEIAIDAVEQARDEINKGLERLYDRLEKILKSKYPKKKKNKKKSSEGHDMVKEAKSTHVNGIQVTVPLFISTIVRTCINSMVSAGKDIEDCFHQLVDKYNLSEREVFEAIQLFQDMGYHVRRPRGYDLDEEIDYTSTDNLDWVANYPA